MSDDATLFRSRAVSEQANADAATLANVRDRCTRSAKAWADMADRAERVTTQRREREREANAGRAAVSQAEAE